VSELEIEVKLVAPTADQLLSLPQHLEGLGLSCAEPEREIARDHYLDTDDLTLYRAGWALRLRDLGTRKVLTMKALKPADDGGVSKREELEQDVAWAGGSKPVFSTQVLDGRLHHLIEDEALKRLFFVRQDRLQFHAGGVVGGAWDGLWIEASMDLVRWEDGDRYHEGFEAELELRGGQEDQLRELSQQLAKATGWQAAGGSKFERGLIVAKLI
jgi:inorganic triphosphatase YgiF